MNSYYFDYKCLEDISYVELADIQDLTLKDGFTRSIITYKSYDLTSDHEYHLILVREQHFNKIIAWGLLCQTDEHGIFPSTIEFKDGTYQCYVHPRHRGRGLANKIFIKMLEKFPNKLFSVMVHDYKSFKLFNALQNKFPKNIFINDLTESFVSEENSTTHKQPTQIFNKKQAG
jgi:GNAT superfamily N-acetyltransferase